MVHALNEIWRVLTPRGRLIDLRPHATNWPLEVVLPTKTYVAGRVDNTPFVPDEVAADAAIGRTVNERRFIPEQQRAFDCAYYWHNLDALLAYYAECGSPPLIISEKVLKRARHLVAAATEESQVRIRLRIMITCYQKHDTA
jgi:hypothetical protein